MDLSEMQRAVASRDWEERRAAALRLGGETGPDARQLQRQLLRDDDLGVIDAMAESLVRSGDVASAALVCEALVTESDQVGDSLNMVLLPLWKSGAVDVPKLLVAVAEDHEGAARQGANDALQWLGVHP